MDKNECKCGICKKIINKDFEDLIILSVTLIQKDFFDRDNPPMILNKTFCSKCGSSMLKTINDKMNEVVPKSIPVYDAIESKLKQIDRNHA